MGQLQNQAQHTDRLEKVWNNNVALNFYDTTEVLMGNYMYCRNWTIGLVGESGCGKNAIVQKAADLLEVDLINFNCLGKLAEDLAAPMYSKTLPVDAQYSDMFELFKQYLSLETTYSYGIFQELQKAFDPEWKGILFFDEAIKADRELRKRIYQFFHDREFDGKKLSPGAMIVCAFNPPQAAGYQLQGLDHAESDRLLFLAVTRSHSEYIAFNEGKTRELDNKLRTIVRRPFIKECRSSSNDPSKMYNLSMYNEYILNKPSFFNQFSSRRLSHTKDTLAYLEEMYQCKLTNIFTDKHLDNIGTVLLNGCIEPSAAHDLIKYIKDTAKINVVKLMNGDVKELKNFADSMSSSTSFVSIGTILSEISSMLMTPKTTLGLKDGPTKMSQTEKLVSNLMEIIKVMNLKNVPDSAMVLLREGIVNTEKTWPEFSDVINRIDQIDKSYGQVIDDMLGYCGLVSSSYGQTI